MSTDSSANIPTRFSNALLMIGDTYTLSIILSLAKGPMRFCEIQRALSGLNPATLSDRLRRMERDNLILRQAETVDKISVVYNLTPKGHGALPVLYQIRKFAEKHL